MNQPIRVSGEYFFTNELSRVSAASKLSRRMLFAELFQNRTYALPISLINLASYISNRVPKPFAACYSEEHSLT